MSSAAVRSRVARLAARITGARRSVDPPLSERYWRRASSSVRAAVIASWPSAKTRSSAASDAPRLTRRTAACRYVAPTSAAASIAFDTADDAPRGHNNTDTTTPTAAPTSTSSTRIRPTLQPVGTITLKMISTIIVNIACPAMNDATSGTYAEPNATSGSIAHITAGSTPINSMKIAPSTKPIPVPVTARSTRVPVVSALLRNTDMAPSTTQKPCWTGKRWVTATATARPRPVRRLLRTTTARVATKPVVRYAMACDSDNTRAAAPASGSRRPSTRAHTGRASASAATPITRPVAPTQADIVRRVNNFRPMPIAVASFGSPRISMTSSR